MGNRRKGGQESDDDDVDSGDERGHDSGKKKKPEALQVSYADCFIYFVNLCSSFLWDSCTCMINFPPMGLINLMAAA